MYRIINSIRIILVISLLSTLVIGQEPVIDGNTVYIDDDNVYMSAYPHTLTSSGSLTFNLLSKKYTGPIDVIFGIDSDNFKPSSAEVYYPVITNTSMNYSCDCPTCWFNYTLNPKHFYCWSNITANGSGNGNQDIVFEHDFISADISSKTAYWRELSEIVWHDVRPDVTVNYEYGGMNTWYVFKDVDVISGLNYTLRGKFIVPISLSGSSGKFWYCVKPSPESIPQAISNGHLYCLDPWWNASWTYYQRINITNTDANTVIAGHPTHVVIDHQALVTAGKSLASGYDLRIVYDTGTPVELDRQCFDNNTASTACWFGLSASIVSGSYDDNYYLYYGNVDATAPVTDLKKVYSGFLDTTKIRAAWYLQEGTGTTIADSAGTNTGTLTGANGGEWRALGKWGKWALNLTNPGTSGGDYVALGNCNVLSLDSSKNLSLFSIALEERLPSSQGHNHWMFWATGTDTLAMGSQNSGCDENIFYVDGNAAAVGSNKCDIMLNRWQTWAGSYNNAGNLQYLIENGTQQDINANTLSSLTIQTSCRLGGYTGGTADTFDGLINQFIATNQFISPAMAATYFNAIEPLGNVTGTEQTNAPTTCTAPTAGANWAPKFSENCTFSNLNVNIANLTWNCDSTGSLWIVNSNISAAKIGSIAPSINTVCSLWIIPYTNIWGV